MWQLLAGSSGMGRSLENTSYCDCTGVPATWCPVKTCSGQLRRGQGVEHGVVLRLHRVLPPQEVRAGKA